MCYNLYANTRFEDMWTVGIAFFENNDMTSFTPTIPFIVLYAVPLIFPFLPKKVENNKRMAWTVYIVTIAVLVLSWFWTEKSDFQNYNYHAEMRMYRAAEEQDWDKVLDEMGNIPGDASREMVLLKNIALLNKGEMGTRMFKYNNMGEPPTNGFDTLRVHMVQTAAPLIYYYHGKTNFALRWGIENSVEFGYSYDRLKILARCALVHGEMEMAKRYLDIYAQASTTEIGLNACCPLWRNLNLSRSIQSLTVYVNCATIWAQYWMATTDCVRCICSLISARR
jgi:hypothetical protein